MRRIRTMHVCAVPVALVVLLSGCGPIEYVNQVTRTGADAIEVARRQNAPVAAPYWWTRALLYHHKAKDQAAHAGFGAANRYGRIAIEAAEKAAEAAAQKPAPMKAPAGAAP
jgi:hypothetical protein